MLLELPLGVYGVRAEVRHKLRLGGARIKLAGQNCQGSIFLQPQVFNARRFSGPIQNATGHAAKLETDLAVDLWVLLKTAIPGPRSSDVSLPRRSIFRV